MSGHEWDDQDRCKKCGDKDWFADAECCESKIKSSIYCPICQRVIVASNIKEVESGEHDGYLFVHDEGVHSDDDIKAVNHGIN